MDNEKIPPDFRPITAWQRSLLEEIEGLKKSLAGFQGTPIENEPSEIKSTQPDIQDFTVKAARSGLKLFQNLIRAYCFKNRIILDS